MTTYYLCNKTEKVVISVGPLPEVWGNISGMADLNYDAVNDLSWAGYPNIGFLTEKDALRIGIPQSFIDLCKQQGQDMMWSEVKQRRDGMIAQVRWRVDRHTDEVALGKSPTENIMPVLKYIQDLRDITNQSDVLNIVWPLYPA